VFYQAGALRASLLLREFLAQNRLEGDALFATINLPFGE
jgi:hypothetical protein